MSKLIRLFKPSTTSAPSVDEYHVTVMDGMMILRDTVGVLCIKAAKASNGNEITIYPGQFPFIIENQ